MTPQRRFPMPTDLMERWWLRIEKRDDGCWIWIGAKWASGYGRFTLPGSQRRVPAHRFGYERLVGPIPDGMQLDHLCRVPACVNPEHLEPVTQAENIRRGISAVVNGIRERSKTHCPRGHAYDQENTYWRPDLSGRNCRACGRVNAEKYRMQRRGDPA